MHYTTFACARMGRYMQVNVLLDQKRLLCIKRPEACPEQQLGLYGDSRHDILTCRMPQDQLVPKT